MRTTRTRITRALAATAVVAMGVAVPAALTGSQAQASVPTESQGSAVAYNVVTGTPDWFVVQPDGAVAYSAYQVHGSWQLWRSLGGDFKGTVSAVSVTSPGKALDVFATATNGDIELDAYTSAGNWTGWRNLGGKAVSNLAVLIVPGTNAIDVFGTTAGGALTQASWLEHRGWQPWHDLGAGVTGTPSAIFDYSTGYEEVFATTTKGLVEEQTFLNGYWGNKRNIGRAGVSGSPSAIYDFQLDQPEVYAVSNHQLTERSWLPRGGWTQADLGGHYTDSPSAVYDSVTGNPEVYAKASNGTLLEIAHTKATGWTGFTVPGGAVQLGSDPVPYVNTTPPPAALDIFAFVGGRPSEVSWVSANRSWNLWHTVG